MRTADEEAAAPADRAAARWQGGDSAMGSTVKGKTISVGALPPVNPDAVPGELRALKRWAPWQGLPKGNGKTDKVPKRCRFPELNASTNERGHWGAFKQALTACRSHHLAGVGFLMTGAQEELPGLFALDLDRCLDEDGGIADWAGQLVKRLPIYWEVSPSGRGLRGFGRMEGTPPPPDFTHANPGLEFYAGSGARFLTVTGRRLEESAEGLPAVPLEALEAALAPFRAGGQAKAKANAPRQPMPELLAQPPAVAGYLSETLQRFLEDGDPGDYASRSEAAFGVACALYRAGLEDAEVLTALQASEHVWAMALDHRRQNAGKALAYLWAECLRAKAVAGAPEPEEFDDLADAGGPKPAPAPAPVPAAHAQSFEEAGLWPPPRGLVRDVAEYTLGAARYPSKAFAVVAALQVVSLATRNRYVVEGGTGLNLYTVMVGPTGCGKEAPREVVRTLARELGLSNTVPESIASGAALLRALAAEPTLLFLSDETGKLLQAAADDRGSVHLKDLLTELMRLYGLSQSTYGGKRYARADDNVPPVHRPFVGLLGATTPETLTGAIGQADVDSGFLNRILYIEVDGLPPRQDKRVTDPDPFMVEELRRLAAEDLEECPNGTPAAVDRLDPTAKATEVAMAPGAKAILDAFHDEARARCPQRPLGPLWVRAHENATRVSGLLGVADTEHPAWPVVEEEHARWACAFVRWCVERFSRLFASHVAENPFDDQVKKAMRFIEHARDYATDARWGRFCKGGWMPRGKLLKLMHMPSTDLDRVARVLEEAGDITVKRAKPHGHNTRPVTLYGPPSKGTGGGG